MKTKIEVMTHYEYKDLLIHYAFYDTPLKEVLIASTNKGVCYIGFSEDRNHALGQLSMIYPNAALVNNETDIHYNALKGFSPEGSDDVEIFFHLYGTDFQLEVWRALLEIPFGHIVSYGDIAVKINRPKACRAVGTAVGNNPVTYLIPCHRVVLSDGSIGNYYWGSELKKQILEWEKSFL